MYSVCTLAPLSHTPIARAMNSGPLSERMCPGVPRMANSSRSTSITSLLLNDRRTSRARHSRVYSSTMLSHFSRTADASSPDPASDSPAPSDHPAGVIDNAGWIAADPSPGTPDALKLQAASARASRSFSDAPGLPVSQVFIGFLENLLVQRQIGHRPLQPAVLLFKLFQTLHCVRLHPAELVPPAV